MNDFEWDSLQKKRIAKQEKYHNRRKKGCSLPSDRLTEAQIRKLHGEVTVLDLNKPMDYAEYVKLPPELQEMYYNHLVIEFGVGCPAIAEMMGTEQGTLRSHNVRVGIKTATVAGKSSQTAREKFESWWGKYDDPYEELQQKLEQRSLDAVRMKAESNGESCQLKRMSFEWHGVWEFEEILKFLGNLPLPNRARIRVTIEEGNDGQMD